MPQCEGCDNSSVSHLTFFDGKFLCISCMKKISIEKERGLEPIYLANGTYSVNGTIVSESDLIQAAQSLDQSEE